MILYTVKNGVYYNLEDFKEDLSDLERMDSRIRFILI